MLNSHFQSILIRSTFPPSSRTMLQTSKWTGRRWNWRFGTQLDRSAKPSDSQLMNADTAASSQEDYE